MRRSLRVSSQMRRSGAALRRRVRQIIATSPDSITESLRKVPPRTACHNAFIRSRLLAHPSHGRNMPHLFLCRFGSSLRLIALRTACALRWIAPIRSHRRRMPNHRAEVSSLPRNPQLFFGRTMFSPELIRVFGRPLPFAIDLLLDDAKRHP